MLIYFLKLPDTDWLLEFQAWEGGQDTAHASAANPIPPRVQSRGIMPMREVAFPSTLASTIRQHFIYLFEKFTPCLS